MSRLAALRSHVEQWRGLNHADASELLDLLEASGGQVEYGFPEHRVDEVAGIAAQADVPPSAMVFLDHEAALAWDGVVWTRVVGPWREAKA